MSYHSHVIFGRRISFIHSFNHSFLFGKYYRQFFKGVEKETNFWRFGNIFQNMVRFQVMEPYYPFKNGSVEDFTIGSEICDGKIGYCNGPLKSGSTYKVKVRAFTAPDKFTDTSYSFPIQTGNATSFFFQFQINSRYFYLVLEKTK